MRNARVGFFLVGSGRFRKIGEGTPRGDYEARKAQEAARMVKDASRRFDVVFPGVVYTDADAQNAISLFFTQKVDCVLAFYLSWSEDFMWNRFLRDMPPVPILYAHRMRDGVNLGDTHDEDEFCEYLCCGGLVGALEASGDNARYQRPMFKTVIGTWDEVLGEACAFSNAARARAILRESQIGLLACYNEVMWSTYVDPYRVFMQVGPVLRFLSVAELCDSIESVPEADARGAMAALRAKYAVKPDVDEGKFFASVRATMGMEKQADKYGLDLLVLNDIDTMLFEKVGLRPGFYPTKEDARALVVPEGDLGAGIAAYALRLLSGNRVNFIEPFHIDPPTDTFEGGHAGPNDYTSPDGQTQIARDVRFAKTKYKYAGAPFAWHVFPAGLKTMLHVSQHGDNFVLAATLVEALPTQAHLATYSHSRFRPVGESCRELFEKLLKLGVTQHYAIADGDCVREALLLGELLGFDCHSV